jgi:hypothetical protein
MRTNILVGLLILAFGILVLAAHAIRHRLNT